MKYMLKVDRTWCAKCKICRQASAGRIVFDGENYPLETVYGDDDLVLVKQGVRKCPIGALTLQNR